MCDRCGYGVGGRTRESSAAEQCSVATNIPLGASLSTLRGDSSSSSLSSTIWECYKAPLLPDNFYRLVSGDYRGFVMIWELDDIKEELVALERRLKNLPKDRCPSASSS